MIKNTSCNGIDDGIIIIDNLSVPLLPAIVTIININTGDPVLDSPYLTPTSAVVTPSGDGWSLSMNGKYGWNNLPAGTYSITIEDSSIPQSCNITREVVIESPDSITFEYNVTPDNCDGDKLNLEIIAEGGTPKYKYIVENIVLGIGPIEKSSPIFKGLVADSIEPYTITVIDFNGCEYTQDIILHSMGGVNVNIGRKDVSCNGLCDGEINVVVTGGVPPYKYVLTSSPEGIYADASDCSNDDGNSCYTFTNLCAGEYVLNVIDSSGCSVLYDRTIEITEPDAIIVDSPVITHITCNNCCDGILTIASITGGIGPYIVEVINGPENAILPATIFTDGTSPIEIKNLSAGNYELSISDSTSCSKIIRFGINSPSQINVNI